jgi:hypothetical protein
VLLPVNIIRLVQLQLRKCAETQRVWEESKTMGAPSADPSHRVWGKAIQGD